MRNVRSREDDAEMRSVNVVSSKRQTRRCSRDGGAALVEFALVAPFLFLMIFGIIEFGNAYFQNLDVRHGAREGARLAAVNYPDNDNTCTPGGSATCNNTLRTALLTETCARIDDAPNVQVRAFRVTGPAGPTTDYEVGDTITVQVRKPLQQLSGFLNPFLKGITLKSNVDTRVEQAARWTSIGTAADSNGWFTCP